LNYCRYPDRYEQTSTKPIAKNMKKYIALLLTYIFLTLMVGCQSQQQKSLSKTEQQQKSIVFGASQTGEYLQLLKNKNIAVVGNNTSVIFKKNNENYTHIVDSLLSLGIKITKVFAPEHGFRGSADAGEHLTNTTDAKTGLPIISLYGENKDSKQKQIYNYRKPTPEQLKDVDIIVFDIQDVGVRFYTYISTLHNVMEACAENDIELIVLDRPNPNGHYIDGPVLDKNSKSFPGLGPIPIVYGMTIGEYGLMTNGEKWLNNGIQCDLIVIPLENYTHQSSYSLPLRPSPNLPNDQSINLYPSLCLFEGTNVSCGRGTEMQFQIFGSPYLPSESYPFTFTPEPNFGSKTPKHMGEKCYGLDLSKEKKLSEIDFTWLINAYQATPEKEYFFREAAFNKLAGNTILKQQIEQGLSMEVIRKTWQKELTAFKKTRSKYLIYED